MFVVVVVLLLLERHILVNKIHDADINIITTIMQMQITMHEADVIV